MSHESASREQLTEELIQLCHRMAHLERESEEQLRNCAELKESEGRYRELFEHIPIGIYRTSPDGEILDANPALAHMFGYETNSNLQTVRALQLYRNPEDRFRWISQCRENETYQCELAMKRVDGSVMWVRDTARAVRDEKGQVRFFEGSLEDITEHRRTEEAVRESENKNRTLVETLQEGLIMVDADENILLANQAFCDITGYSKEELLAMNMADLVPENEYLLLLGETAKRKKGFASQYELTVIGKDTRINHIRVSAAPIRDETGVFRYTVALMLDITERVRARKIEQAVKIISQAVLEETEIKQFYATMHGAIAELMPADNFFVALYDRKKGIIAFPYFVDQNDPWPDPRPIANGLTDRVLKTGKTICADRDELSEMAERGEITRIGSLATAWLGVPLIHEGKSVGALVVQIYGNGKRFSHDDRTILEVVSTQVALAVERKNTFESIRSSEKKYRTLTENLNVGVYRNTVGPDGRFIEANPALINMFGYASKDEFLAINVSDLYQDPNQRVKFNEKMLSDGFVREEELSLKSKSGTPLIGSISAVAVRGEDNRILYFDGIIEDITERKRAEELQQTFERLRKTLEGTVHALAATSETTDPYTAGHQQRVALLATAIARKLDLPEKQVEGINVAATLHDIGKIYVPPAILSRPGRLAEIEFSMIKAHPTVGYDILKAVDFPWPIAEFVLKHHERLDGSGYPQGLREEDIPVDARILGVADVVEAMSSHRPYRPALGLEQALVEIRENRGLLYDEKVVDACISLFNEDGFSFEDPEQPADP